MTDVVLEMVDEDIDEYLAHHGILGQKWGKQNGPPYPLDAADHSAAEKKAGWRQSLSDAGEKASTAIKATKAKVEQKKKEKAEQKKQEEELKAWKERRAIIESGDADKVSTIASDLSTAELREATDRINLMATVNRNATTPTDTINGAIDKLDKAATTVQKGVSAYNKIANIYNLFNDPPMTVLDSSLGERRRQEEDRKKKDREEAERKAKEATEESRKALADRVIKSDDTEMLLRYSHLMTSQEVTAANTHRMQVGKARDENIQTFNDAKAENKAYDERKTAEREAAAQKYSSIMSEEYHKPKVYALPMHDVESVSGDVVDTRKYYWSPGKDNSNTSKVIDAAWSYVDESPSYREIRSLPMSSALLLEDKSKR